MQRVVIIGGGILGCTIAYQLTKMGEPDVVILEQHRLTDGATWHAAGLVGQLRSSRNTTRMLEHSVEMYGRLEAETGQAVDWHQVGSLRLPCSPERVMELRRLTTMAKSFGLPMDIICAERAQALFPLMSDRRRAAAAFLPTDGYIDPACVTQALAKGARMRNARIFEDTAVTAITVDGRRVHHGPHRSRRHRVRVRRQRRRDVGHAGRSHGRRAGAGRARSSTSTC